MRMSIRTRSGERRRARSTACRPSSASPTTRARGLGLEQLAKARPHERLVVADQHAQAHRAEGSGRGNPARSRRAALGPGTGLHRPVVKGDALAHADESVSAAVLAFSLAGPGSVVGDLELEVPVRRSVTSHPCPRWAGVFERVGQRLLHDPVGGEIDARGQRAWVALRSGPGPAVPPRAPSRPGRGSAARLGCGGERDGPRHRGASAPAGGASR